MSIDETPAEDDRSPESVAAADIAGLTIAEVREKIAAWAGDHPGWAELEKDRRVGVRKLVVERRRREARQQIERERQVKMLHFEQRHWDQGASGVAGVDEAGRGCLAGPVVAAAVVLPPDCAIVGLDDSKKLSPSRREALYEQILTGALSVGVGQVEAAEIDRLNIPRPRSRRCGWRWTRWIPRPTGY